LQVKDIGHRQAPFSKFTPQTTFPWCFVPRSIPAACER
jgi:hypothetical protein